ncbi:hypothetical protein [Rhodothermus marinus]|uniref:hypothetical protein n=1 Tax=Rhodothermus marinus TaxID=29549 RepID=UPI0006D28F70|nr:hypothetical protein [Rhodothermus marinus]
MSGSFYPEYEEVIERARQKGVLTEAARLILWGRITEAFALGKLTYSELKALEAQLGIDSERYRRDLDIALSGEPEEDD